MGFEALLRMHPFDRPGLACRELVSAAMLWRACRTEVRGGKFRKAVPCIRVKCATPLSILNRD